MKCIVFEEFNYKYVVDYDKVCFCFWSWTTFFTTKNDNIFDVL